MNTSKGWKNLTNNFEKRWENPNHDFSWTAGQSTDPTDNLDEYENLKDSKKLKKGAKSRASQVAGYLFMGSRAKVRREEINTEY